ncbi:cytochrome P450 [Amycolatopsis antarctica]|uniref:Cytochrome P450 n=1 Tax=Amycolatopsis antarctica TaxID=1854586 RepID=A0A263D9V9_9PSEU|nr:cytochrome P450 [Amycolatopsis antarctica]
MATCPFAAGTRGLDEPAPVRAEMRAAGPVVRAEAPAGGPVWIVTDPDLARAVLADPKVSKDTALAPRTWGRWTAGLEPSAAEQPALTTLEGQAHARLRRAHAPLLGAKRMTASYPRMVAIARDLLAPIAGEPVDLMADFSTRYPLTVLCELLGVPLDGVDTAMTACRGMHSQDQSEVAAAMSAFTELATAALNGGAGIATELAARMPGDTSREDLHYQIFALLFAGQLTTDPALGFLVARLLGDPGSLAAPGSSTAVDEAAVGEVLRLHPPAPFTLWRFTTTEIELAGIRLPAGAPLLIDIEGVNAVTAPGGQDLAFGAGPHYCIGAQLARHELCALAEVLRTRYPAARLTVPYADLRRIEPGGILGSRLAALPVVLR